VFHVFAKTVENALTQSTNRLGFPHPPEKQSNVKDDHVEPGLGRIRNAVVPIEQRMAGLCHDGAIERFDGVRAARRSDEGESHSEFPDACPRSDGIAH
jgi:hypothetical protein